MELPAAIGSPVSKVVCAVTAQWGMRSPLVRRGGEAVYFGLVAGGMLKAVGAAIDTVGRCACLRGREVCMFRELGCSSGLRIGGKY